MTSEDRATKRADKFIDAIEKQAFGKCPDMDGGNCGEVPLWHGIRWQCMVFVHIGYVVSVDVTRMSKEEIEYCLMVCEKLGYNPKW